MLYAPRVWRYGLARASYGGEAWDAKIKKQIKECALFMPIISAHTQERAEGYFRLEWHLAEQRTYLMAHDQPFLTPVVVDDTADSAARVPERFRERQWSRRPGGDTPRAFEERVKKLLGGSAADPGQHRPVPSGAISTPHPAKRTRPWFVAIISGVIACAALAIWQPWRKGEKPTPPGSAATTPPPPAPLSEARQLVQRAGAVWDYL